MGGKRQWKRINAIENQLCILRFYFVCFSEVNLLKLYYLEFLRVKICLNNVLLAVGGLVLKVLVSMYYSDVYLISIGVEELQ